MVFLTTKQETTITLVRHLTSREDWEWESFGCWGDDNMAYETFYLHQTSTHNLYTFSNPFKCIGKMKKTKRNGEYAVFHMKHNIEMIEQYKKYKTTHNNQLKEVLEEMEIDKFNPRSVGGKLDFDRRAEEDGIVWRE